MSRHVKLFWLGRSRYALGRGSRGHAVDRGAAGFATLQADVVAAMAKAGQRRLARLSGEQAVGGRRASSNLGP